MSRASKKASPNKPKEESLDAFDFFKLPNHKPISIESDESETERSLGTNKKQNGDEEMDDCGLEEVEERAENGDEEESGLGEEQEDEADEGDEYEYEYEGELVAECIETDSEGEQKERTTNTRRRVEIDLTGDSGEGSASEGSEDSDEESNAEREEDEEKLKESEEINVAIPSSSRLSPSRQSSTPPSAAPSRRSPSSSSTSPSFASPSFTSLPRHSSAPASTSASPRTPTRSPSLNAFFSPPSTHTTPTTTTTTTTTTSSAKHTSAPKPRSKPKPNFTSPVKGKKLTSPMTSPGNIRDFFKPVKRDETKQHYDSVVEISMKLPEGHQVKATISYHPPPQSDAHTQTHSPLEIPTSSSSSLSLSSSQSPAKPKRKRGKKKGQHTTPQRPPPQRIQPSRTQPPRTSPQTQAQTEQLPRVSPTQTQAQQPATTQAPKKKTLCRPKEINGRRICLFCGKTAKESTYEGKMMLLKKTDVFIHSECLYSASRGTDEAIGQMVNRIAGPGRLLPCKFCKQKVGSVGCVITSCPNIYHYKCAIESGGKWDPGTRVFYCAKHFESIDAKLILEYKALTKWPTRSKVNYLRDNIWDEIKPTHRDYIARYARIEGERAGDEEDMWTVAWEFQSFIPRIEVREIGPGHWAWCTDLATVPNGQFEGVAAHDIKQDDFIGEYIGRVRYENPSTLRNPYVTSMFVPANTAFRKKMGDSFAGLCIDSSAEGNETRFINSVTRHSPCHIRQNATMDTVWCRGQLRVIIRAIMFIPKGTAIVLNYDEYIKADGSRPYFADSDSDGETEVKHTSFNVNGVRLPSCAVVVPNIPKDYTHPKKKLKNKTK